MRMSLRFTLYDVLCLNANSDCSVEVFPQLLRLDKGSAWPVRWARCQVVICEWFHWTYRPMQRSCSALSLAAVVSPRGGSLALLNAFIEHRITPESTQCFDQFTMQVCRN